MRLLKLFGVLLATIAAYLVMLHFKVQFGIALIIAMAIMWYGVKKVRERHPESEEYAEEPAQSSDDSTDELSQTRLPEPDEDIE